MTFVLTSLLFNMVLPCSGTCLKLADTFMKLLKLCPFKERMEPEVVDTDHQLLYRPLQRRDPILLEVQSMNNGGVMVICFLRQCAVDRLCSATMRGWGLSLSPRMATVTMSVGALCLLVGAGCRQW